MVNFSSQKSMLDGGQCSTFPLSAKDLDTAVRLLHGAIRLICRDAIKQSRGVSWTNLTYEGQPDTRLTFYNGTSGIVYVLLKAFIATQEEEYYQTARAGLDFILSQLQDVKTGRSANGLFDGAAGLGYLLLYAYTLTNNSQLSKAAENLARQIIKKADISFSSSVDLISGAAGTGLFLLKMFLQTRNDEFLAGAQALAEFVIRRAEQAPVGVKWKTMHLGRQYYFTGFAHGAAGVAFYLQCMSEVTSDKRYGEYATLGAEMLSDIAIHEGNGVKWYRDGFRERNIFSSQWCHGSAGINALLLALYRHTRSSYYLELAIKNVSYLLAQGINVKKNASLCHGVSGNAACLYAMFNARADGLYLAHIREGLAILENTAEIRADGYYWPSAISYQLDYGYMSGIAGVADFCNLLCSGGAISLMTGLGFGGEL